MPRDLRREGNDVDADARAFAALFVGPARAHWSQVLALAGAHLADPGWRAPENERVSKLKAKSPHPKGFGLNGNGGQHRFDDAELEDLY